MHFYGRYTELFRRNLCSESATRCQLWLGAYRRFHPRHRLREALSPPGLFSASIVNRAIHTNTDDSGLPELRSIPRTKRWRDIAAEYDAERRRSWFYRDICRNKQVGPGYKHEQIKEGFLCSTMFSAARTVIPRASMRVSYASVLFLHLA